MVNMRDVTFTIPTRLDSVDRQHNLVIIIEYLLHHFDTNIIVCEQDTHSKCKSFWNDKLTERNCRLIFIENKEPFFHKTANLNIMAREVDTPIIVSMDSDVLFPPEQYVAARDILLSGKADCVYPFDGPTLNIPKMYHKGLYDTYSLGDLGTILKPAHLQPPPGGCLFMNRDKFFQFGQENENFIGWGPEDRERLHRFLVLGATIHNVKGNLFHLTHVRTSVSAFTHIYRAHNDREYEKITKFSREELEKYVQTWPWLNKRGNS